MKTLRRAAARCEGVGSVEEGGCGGGEGEGVLRDGIGDKFCVYNRNAQSLLNVAVCACLVRRVREGYERCESDACG